MHVLAWLPDLPIRDLPALVDQRPRNTSGCTRSAPIIWAAHRQRDF